MGMLGSGKAIETEECTQLQWTGTAQELIIFNLVEKFQRCQNHPILDAKVSKIGLSFKPHRKYENVFQILYVK